MTIDALCPICRNPPTGAVHRCPECYVLLCAECFAYSQGCATYGCKRAAHDGRAGKDGRKIELRGDGLDPALMRAQVAVDRMAFRLAAACALMIGAVIGRVLYVFALAPFMAPVTQPSVIPNAIATGSMTATNSVTCAGTLTGEGSSAPIVNSNIRTNLEKCNGLLYDPRNITFTSSTFRTPKGYTDTEIDGRHYYVPMF